jgi:hypothetical protein
MTPTFEPARGERVTLDGRYRESYLPPFGWGAGTRAKPSGSLDNPRLAASSNLFAQVARLGRVVRHG